MPSTITNNIIRTTISNAASSSGSSRYGFGPVTIATAARSLTTTESVVHWTPVATTPGPPSDFNNDQAGCEANGFTYDSGTDTCLVNGSTTTYDTNPEIATLSIPITVNGKLYWIFNRHATFHGYVTENGGALTSFRIEPLTSILIGRNGLTGNTWRLLERFDDSGGVSEILTGNTIWVDGENGDDDEAIIGRQDKPYETIAAAVAAWTAGNTIHIRPGNYNEQVLISSGMYIYSELGVIINYTGSGGTFKTSGEDGQVKIGGFGRYYHSGTQATQYVFEIGDEAETEEHWHVDVTYEDCRCIIGRSSEGGAHGLMGLGTSLANAAARAAAAPVAIGEHGYQVDTKVHYIATGTSAGNWTALSAAAVKVNSGYIMLRGHSVDGVNCHGIRWLAGSCDEQNERVTATGLGCNALNVGTTNDISPRLNQFWLRSLKVAADPNEATVYIHDNVTNINDNDVILGNVLYITTQGFYGNFEDDESSGIALYFDGQLALPTYAEGFPTTRPHVLDFNGPSSFYQVNIGDVVGNCTGAMIRSAGLLYGRFARLEPIDAGVVLDCVSGTAYISYLNANGTFVESGGTIVEAGGEDADLSFTRDATTVTVESSTGTDAILPAATVSLAGVMTAADKSELTTATSVLTSTMRVNGPGAWNTYITIAGGDGSWNDGAADYDLSYWSISANEERGDVGVTGIEVHAINGAYFHHAGLTLGVRHDESTTAEYIVSNPTKFRAASLSAAIASPTFTGIPAAPTAAANTNTTQIATTAFVGTAVANLVASSPAALDTLNEFALALGNDANFSTTITTSIGLKAPLASPALTGNPTAPTQTVDNDTTRLATTAYVIAQGYLKSSTAATTYLALAGSQMTAAIRHTELTYTPSGASPSQTIALAISNAITLACTSATGTIAATLTRPTGSYTGTIIVKVHATTATGITWAVSAGTLYWLGTQPTWAGLAVGKRLVVSVRCDGTDTYLAATEVNT